MLVKINQKVGFRFLTKFGSKGLVNLGKLIPGVGAVISGGLDLTETKIIADRAYKWFLEGDFTVKDAPSNDIVIEAEVSEFNDVDILSEDNRKEEVIK